LSLFFFVFLKNKQNITDNGPQAGTAFVTLDEMEFNRRMAIEKELEKSESKSLANVGERFVFFLLPFSRALLSALPRTDSLPIYSV